MFRLYLSDRWRLHVWAPQFAVPGVTTLHTHPWHFTSHVLAGGLIDRQWFQVDGAPTHMRQMIVCGPYGGIDGSPEPTRLEMCAQQEIREGESYHRFAAAIHETFPSPGTVTLIERTPLPDSEHALVFFPVGTEWISAIPRKAERAEVEAMRALALACLGTENQTPTTDGPGGKP